MREERMAEYTCGRLPYPGFSTASETLPNIVQQILTVAVAWAIVWYVCAAVAMFLEPRLPTSSKPWENQAVYVGQKLAATVKVVLIASLSNIALVTQFDDPLDEQFAGGSNAETAGILFTSFELADLVLCSAHRFIGAEDVVHHLIHIVLGFFIRANCAPCYNASILMAQETSSLFLNYYLLLRHRSPDAPSVKILFVVFAACFAVWRLGIGTVGTVYYLRHADHLPPDFSALAARCIGGILVGASVLQWYWGVAIVRGVRRKLCAKPPPKELM